MGDTTFWSHQAVKKMSRIGKNWQELVEAQGLLAHSFGKGWEEERRESTGQRRSRDVVLGVEIRPRKNIQTRTSRSAVVLQVPHRIPISGISRMKDVIS